MTLSSTPTIDVVFTALGSVSGDRRSQATAVVSALARSDVAKVDLDRWVTRHIETLDSVFQSEPKAQSEGSIRRLD